MYYPRSGNKDKSPDSESDWDDNTISEAPSNKKDLRGNNNTAPRIELSSGDEKLVKAASKQTSKQQKGKQDKKESKHESTKVKKNQNAQIKQPYKSKVPDNFTFTDNGMESEEEDIVPSRHRTPREDNPPYDFRGALPSDTHQGSPMHTKSLGNKGSNYHPSPPTARTETHGDGSWDDSDDGERTLKNIGKNFRKNATPVPQIRLTVDNTANKHTDKHDDDDSNYDTGNAMMTHANQENKDDQPDMFNVVLNEKQSKKLKKKSHKPHFTLGDPEVGEDGYVYYFEEGHMQYYETQKDGVPSVMNKLANTTEKLSRRLWLEFFGVLRIIISFFAIFAVELIKFISRHIFYGLIIGILSTIGDFIFKPLLSVVFNGFLQPVLIFIWNIMSGLRHALSPVIDILKVAAVPLVMMFRACRLVEINWKNTVHNRLPNDSDGNMYYHKVQDV